MEKLSDALPNDLVALVVDDDAFARNLGRKLLESIGIATVLTAETGADAIGLVASKSARIDIVLCDLHMPGIDGFETRRRLRALAPAMPFVMVTGDSREAAIVAARAHEISAYLVKPISPKQLREKVEAALLAAPHIGPSPWLRTREGIDFKHDAPAEMQALFEAWDRARGIAPIPGRAALAEWRLDNQGGFADALALVEVERPGPRLRYRHVGGLLVKRLGRDPTGKCLDEQPFLYRRHAQPAYDKVLHDRSPHYRHVRVIETLFLLDYRRLLLPFGDDGHVSSILACFV
ncbi:MAG: response regulator [Alphaproteobacteria bacterium]|nr:response regulator [Alphaproteobacteria bacterium]